MAKIVLLLAGVLLTAGLSAQCSRGCLSCDPEGKICTFCDIVAGYIFRDGRCVQQNPTNCRAIDFLGNCLLCSPGYFPALPASFATSAGQGPLSALWQPSLAAMMNKLPLKTIVAGRYDLNNGPFRHLIEAMYEKVKLVDFTNISNSTAWTNFTLVPNLTTAFPLLANVSVFLNQTDAFNLTEMGVSALEPFFRWTNFTNLLSNLTASNLTGFGNATNFATFRASANWTQVAIDATLSVWASWLTYEDLVVIAEFVSQTKPDLPTSDSELITCAAVPDDKLVLNCTAYDDWARCVKCDSTFFLSNGLCHQVPSSVRGCQVYAADGAKCAECSTNYVLSPDRSRCDFFERNVSCLQQNYLNCYSCASGYFFSPNSYRELFNQYVIQRVATDPVVADPGLIFEEFRIKRPIARAENIENATETNGTNSTDSNSTNGTDTSTTIDYSKYFEEDNNVTDASVRVRSSQELLQYFNYKVLGINSPAFVPFCVPVTVFNCAEYLNENTCFRCQDNYFVNTKGGCSRIPDPSVPNCLIYYAASVCLTCANGYFLSSSNGCIAVSVIDDCVKYDGAATSTVCLACKDGFYASMNVCVARTRPTIAHCSVLNGQADVCLTCLTGYALTPDATACLEVIVGCATYDPLGTPAALTCSACQAGMFLSSNTCTAGSVLNCTSYAAAGACSACDAKYFLASPTNCTAHPILQNCEVYDPVVSGTCTRCASSHLLFSYNSMCEKIIAIENCKTYSDKTTCSACKDRFVLTTNTCVAIPASENCLQKDPATLKCIKCDTGYYISADVCVKHYAFQLDRCATIANDGLAATEMTCSACKDYSIEFDFANQHSCFTATELGITAIANCVRHSLDFSTTPKTLTCTRCATGMVLNNARSACVANCDANVPVIISTFTGTSVIGPMCDSAVDATTASLYILDGTRYVASCSATAIEYRTGVYLPFNFPTLKGATVGSALAQTYNITSNFGTSYEEIKCDAVPALPAVPVYVPSDATTRTNCEFWDKSGSSYLCKRCKKGYTGIPASDHVVCDRVVSGCDTNVHFGGLDHAVSYITGTTKLSALFSCHKCHRKDQVPIVYIKSDGTFVPFNKANPIPSAGAGLTSSAVECVIPTAKGLGYEARSFLATVPENCALLVAHVDKEKDFKNLVGTATETSLYCAACRPGFKKVLDGSSNLVACAPIEFCDSLFGFQSVNKCASCLPGWTWKTTVAGGVATIDGEVCLRQKDTNCFLSDVNDLCYICKTGFRFNYDGVCEAVELPLCASAQYSEIPTTISTLANYPELRVKAFDMGAGCRSCASPTLAVLPVTPGRSMKACARSPYARRQNFPPSTVFVHNCKAYLSGISPSCSVCEQNFVISTDGKSCLDLRAFPGCSAVNKVTGMCTSCQTGFVLVKGLCEVPRIPNCKVYSTSPLAQGQQCDLCAPGFVSYVHTCVPGTVNLCETYDLVTKACTKCLTGNFLAEIQGTQYCLAIRPEFNCSSVDQTLVASRRLACSVCSSAEYIIAPAAATFTDICLPLQVIDGCKVYANTGALLTSVLTCQTCQDGFFRHTETSCLPRKRIVPRCLTYHQNYDFCSTCEPAHYLSNNKTCEPYPTGIYGCQVYTSNTTCAECSPGMYLTATLTCAAVEDLNLVPNCLKYINETNCQSCSAGYILTGSNTCLAAVAKSCKTYLSENKCDQCLAGYGLKERAGTNIVDCVKKFNANCLLIGDFFPFDCLQCNKFYFLSSGRCFPIKTVISNCASYLSETECKSCDPGYILSSDKLSCVTLATYNITTDVCSDVRYEPKPTCTLCDFGYVFSPVPGVCEKCSYSIEEGCAVCSMTNRSLCDVCNTGYYNKNGTCMPWNVTSTTEFLFVAIKVEIAVAMFAALFALIFN